MLVSANSKEIIVNKDVMVHCGNAPKMERVIDLTVSLAARDEAAAKTHLRDDFTWTEVGMGRIADFSSLGAALAARPEVSSIAIENALSHGNGAMCEGWFERIDGRAFHFCSVAKFVSTAKNAAVKALHMYLIDRT